MYCQNCGKETSSKKDNYCRYCGKFLGIENKEEIIKSEKNQYSMKWFNFFNKIYLPIIIFVNSIIIAPQVAKLFESNTYDLLFILNFILNTSIYIIIPILTFSKLESSKETGYKFLLLFLLSDYILKILLTPANALYQYGGNFIEYLILSTIISSIWFVPNIIYFFKRKSLFIE